MQNKLPSSENITHGFKLPLMMINKMLISSINAFFFSQCFVSVSSHCCAAPNRANAEQGDEKTKKKKRLNHMKRKKEKPE